MAANTAGNYHLPPLRPVDGHPAPLQSRFLQPYVLFSKRHTIPHTRPRLGATGLMISVMEHAQLVDGNAPHMARVVRHGRVRRLCEEGEK